MNKSYKKKLTKKDIFLLNKYLIKFKKNVNDNLIESIFKTSKYTITIYKNGTLLIQGTGYENILKMIDPKYESNTTSVKFQIKNKIIGSDEVGNGDTFGGMTFCAVYIDDKNINFFKEENITDSKKYTNEQICNLYTKIKSKLNYAIVDLPPNLYNKIYEKYNNQNIVKTYGHNLAISNLYKKIKINIDDSTSIIDQFASLNLYKKYIKSIDGAKLIGNEYTITKAESKYAQVAAASIIARYYFIQQMSNLSKKIGFALPYGSSTNIIQTTINKIKNKRININEYAKMHFKIFN